MLMMEKKDACYYKVKASAKVWPSAYASGRLVQCRKKGAGNYGNKSEGVAEGWVGALTGGALGLFGGPVGALFGAWIGHALQEELRANKAKTQNLMAQGDVYQVYFDSKDISGKLFSYIDAFDKMTDLAKKPHDIEKYFDIVDSTTGNSVFKYRAKADASNFLKKMAIDSRDELRQAQLNQTHEKFDLTKINLDFDYFTKEFVNRVEGIAKSNKWDILKAAGYLQELSNTNDHPFGHPTDWQKLKTLVSNDYNTESLKTLGQTLKTEFKKSKDYFKTKESVKQGVAEDQEKRGRGRPSANDQRQEPVQAGRVEKTATGMRHHADPSRYGGTEPEHELDTLNRGRVSSMDKALGVKWDRESKRYFSPIKVDEEDNNPDYVWIQGDFDGDTAATGSKQGSWRDQQTTQVELTRGRMSNVRPLSGPPPEGGKTIKQAKISLTLDAGNQKFSTTGVDLQLTVAPNGYISQGGVGRVRGTAVVKIMRPGSVAEDISRRGFLRGLSAAALGATGVAATGNAQARATPEWMEKVAQSKELLSKGLTPEQVAKKLGVTGPNNNMAGPMGGDWGAINYAVREVQRARGTGMNEEGYNPEYDDEAGMADNNLETLKRTVEGIDDLIQSGDNLPEWCQEKIAVAKSMLVAVWDYMYSEEASDEVDPEIDAMFEAMDQLAEEMAAKNNVSADLVWEQFEAMPDNMLYETAAWRRKEGKSKKGGLNAKGVASYRRENPGSKLQTAVTTKPSKLKPGSKAAKRRKSFCARMGGVKGPMKKPNGKPTRKALALRKWNC
jgi:hypothetical protein